MSDTTTVLNPGAGGDSMDETLAVQSDGSTTGKRPRVELALADNPSEANGQTTPSLVNRTNPLPVYSNAIEGLLRELVDEVRLLRKVMSRC